MTILKRPLMLVLGLALTGVSCTENAPPKSDPGASAMQPVDMKLMAQPGSDPQPTVTTSSPGAVAAAPQAKPPAAVVQVPKRVIPKEDIVVPPPEAHYTLFVANFDGPNHVDAAKAAKEQLKAATNSTKFYIVHGDAHSEIYYGFYRDIDSKTKFGKQAQADKNFLKNLKTSSGETPFATIYFKPIDSAAPDAPPEWDLANMVRSPQKYWSLQIAAYTADGRAENPGDSTDRKTAAVESVRDLRAHGIEAYFFHGPSTSSVCVGCWPENAVRRQSGGDAAGNAGTSNPNDRLLVADALPSNLKSIKTPDGERVKALTPKLEVLDAGMMATMKQFPTHAINGYEMMRTFGKGNQQTTKPDPSVLVLVPEAKQAMPTGLPTDAELMNLQLNGGPSGVTQPGMGKLRSIGE